MQRHLVIMARAPRLGTVKRRLARDIGTVAAWRFYRGETASLLRRLSVDPRWLTWLAVTPDAALAGGGLWPFRGILVGQGPGDLGQRMGRLFAALPNGPLVIIGSDIPGITSAHVAGAFSALGRREWVIGPASDGGYWLVGARRVRGFTKPFEGVRWSSRHTLQDTLRNLGSERVELLGTLADVDDGEGYHHWRQSERRR